MGKTLLELLEAWPTPDKLNPNRQKAGMLKPEPDNKFTNDNKQALDFVKKMPKVYGTDIIRITTSTDPHEAKKAIKKAADKVGGALGGLGMIGKVIGAGISKVAEFHPKFPDDWTKGEDGKPTGMENNFYAGLINGDYAFGKRYNPYHKNSKSKLGNFLASNKTPDQAANAIGGALKTAAVGLAVGLITAGIVSLFSRKKGKKKGKEGPAIKKKKEKPNTTFYVKDKFGKPYFPSSLLINTGFGEPGYGLSFRNYSRLSQRNGNLGVVNYLEKDGATLLKEVAPTLDEKQFTDIDNTHGITEYYAQVLINNTPQTINSGNVMVSANLHNASNNYEPQQRLDTQYEYGDGAGEKGGYYLSDRQNLAEGRAVDDLVKNYSRFVDADGNAFIQFGIRSKNGYFSNNDIEKASSLSIRYGANGVYGHESNNLLTLDIAKPDAEVKINSATIGNTTWVWSPTGTSYTKDSIKDKNASIQIDGDKYANEVNVNDLRTSNGGLSQHFGTWDTSIVSGSGNLIKIVKGANDYTFDAKKDDGSDTLIAKIKGGEEYEYTESELKISTWATDEQSRFIDGGIADLGKSKLIKGYTSNVETQLGQQFVDAFVSVNIDTKKEEEYKYPFRTIGQMDTVARWNTKDAKFSDNVKTITDNDTNFLNTALQTQTQTSLNINPYLHKKRDILKDNVEDGIVKVNIGGINFLSTITNLSDKSAASWDSVKPIGSGVNFYLFNVWERDISFDLKLYAENKTQLDQIWKKVESLSLFTKGKTTNSAKGVFGRIIGLEIGDLISAQGFLSDITMAVDDATPWEITKGSQAPMICSISVSFKVVTNGEADYSFYNTLKA
jgi:hypothetical protein